MMSDAPSVLIVDDDPDHLKIYGWILERAELKAVPCLVKKSGVGLPKVEEVALVVLDYSLHTEVTPSQVAEQLHAEFPEAPIVLLSDVERTAGRCGALCAGICAQGEPGEAGGDSDLIAGGYCKCAGIKG